MKKFVILVTVAMALQFGVSYKKSKHLYEANNTQVEADSMMKSEQLVMNYVND